MVRVFSFTVFGSDDKYCKGLLRNIELIQKEFPTFETWVYIGNDVPAHILNELHIAPKVRCFFTGEVGMVNKFHRFFAIDDPEVEVMFVRDADSRIFKRDISTIHEFLESDKKFHLVRDHPNHFHKIMAGCLAIRSGLLSVPLRTMFEDYRKANEVTTFWNDQEFLVATFWPRVLEFSMIHDDLQDFEPYSIKTRIKEPIGNGLHFIGQVYEFDEQGNEYPKFTDYFEGGVHGKAFWTAERLERVGLTNLPGDVKGIHVFIQIFQNIPKQTDSEEQRQLIDYRNKEYERCFLINVEQPFIRKIYVFYEKDDDKNHYLLLSKGYEEKVVFIKHWRQAFYKDYMIYMKNNIPDNEVCCILAGDIYLNYDIKMNFFDAYLPVNTLFGITRHEPTDKYHTICDEKTCGLAHSAGGCGDCFIFRTPIPPTFNYEQVDHRQNRWGGECNYCDAWHRIGAKVVNPCYQVKTIHVHKDSVYPNTPNPVRVSHGRPYLPDLEPAPFDSNHCINRPSALYEPGSVVCFRCKAHPNVFCKWHKGGRDWTCNICEMYNEFEYRDWARQRAQEE